MCLLGSEISSQTPTAICHQRTLKSATIEFNSCVAILSEKVSQNFELASTTFKPEWRIGRSFAVSIVNIITFDAVETCSSSIVVVNKVNVDNDKWISILTFVFLLYCWSSSSPSTSSPSSPHKCEIKIEVLFSLKPNVVAAKKMWNIEAGSFAKCFFFWASIMSWRFDVVTSESRSLKRRNGDNNNNNWKTTWKL